MAGIYSAVSKAYGFSLKQNLRPNAIELPEKEILGLVEPLLCGDYFCLRNEVMEAYLEMQFEADKSGIKLWCTSGYRDFIYQKNIWNAKFRKLTKQGLSAQNTIIEIMKYSALPGASRHHWGTDLDIVDALSYQIYNPLQADNFMPEGEFQFLKYWLDTNANRFGFFEVYTNEKNRTGFMFEPWHYSFAPLSKLILKQVLEIDFSKIDEMQLCKGNEFFTNTFFENYKKQYILGINPDLIF